MSGDYRQLPPSNIPIPDPTVITAQEIAKARDELRNEFRLAVSGLRDTLVAARDGFSSTINTRLDAMDKAADLQTARIERMLEDKIANIRTQFDSIDLQFRERDVRFMQDKAAVSSAIDAALQAQKEAARVQNDNIAATFAKSETFFTKENDSLRVLINATKDAVTADIANLTGRLDRGEGGYQGARAQTQDSRANMTQTIAIVSGIVGFLVLLVMIGGLWVNSHGFH
jgi:cobalamin biosynthesis Mg chelatase CobN